MKNADKAFERIALESSAYSLEEKFSLRGEGSNIQLDHLRNGKPYATRPASPEELLMWQEIRRLRNLLAELDVELETTVNRLDAANAEIEQMKPYVPSAPTGPDLPRTLDLSRAKAKAVKP